MKVTPKSIKALEKEVQKVRDGISIKLNELFYKVTGDPQFKQNCEELRKGT